MTEMLLDGLRHLLTLLFGIEVSAAFLDIAPTRKNIVILSVFSALDFIVLCILFLLQSDSVTYAFYPLLTHMPLVLLFTLAFKCRCKRNHRKNNNNNSTYIKTPASHV